MGARNPEARGPRTVLAPSFRGLLLQNTGLGASLAPFCSAECFLSFGEAGGLFKPWLQDRTLRLTGRVGADPKPLPVPPDTAEPERTVVVWQDAKVWA